MGDFIKLTNEEEQLVQEIRKTTQELNTNNITRTKAYLHYYKHFPEIHWAFLGHMVSRNGGWNMSDLKGELLENLLSKQEKKDFFLFLERANWLIFQDAFPQLLLYEKSMQRNKPLFYLCPALNISVFMEAVWNTFWQERDSEIITIALIINEQNYLETRMIQNPTFQQKVLHTPEFKLQELFSFNQILFPYYEQGEIKLVGRTMRKFGLLSGRIEFGKELYALLFQNPERLNAIKNWAADHPHTGSRKDFWPGIFHSIREELPGKYQLHLKNCKLRAGASRIYSPFLVNVWRNVNHPQAETGDWYREFSVVEGLFIDTKTINGEIQNEYCKTLERIELASIAKKAITTIN